MKKLIMAAAALSLFAGASFAADGEVTLETFDKCNNWARQYCQSGEHENAVNSEILRLKKAGIPITLERIKLLAQTINMNKFRQANQPK